MTTHDGNGPNGPRNGSGNGGDDDGGLAGMKAAWAAHGALLERSLAINERLLRTTTLRGVRLRLLPYVAWRALELVLGIALLVLAMPVLVAHLGEPRYLGAAGALIVYLIGFTAVTGYLLGTSLQLDFAGPVTALQRAIAHLRGVEYQALKWAVLGGVVIWLPAALVVFEAVTGVPVLGRADLAWLVANLAFGLAVLALGQALSKKFIERPDLAPWARRLLDAVSGRGLRAATHRLAELARFTRDDA